MRKYFLKSVVFWISLILSCGEKIQKKVISEEDYIAPFGRGSTSWDNLIYSDTSFLKLNFDSKFEEKDPFTSEKYTVLAHSPQKVSSVVIRNTEYIIPQGWEGYILKFDAPFEVQIYYCIAGQICEAAEKIKGAPNSEFFFSITSGTKPVFLVYRVQFVKTLLGSEAYYYPKYYLCSDGLDHVLCEADEFSYIQPNAVMPSEKIEEISKGKIYLDSLTAEIISLKEVKFALRKTIYIDDEGKEHLGETVFSSALLYELVLSFTGELGVKKSSLGEFPEIQVLGCGTIANEQKCWSGFREIEIMDGNIEIKPVENFQVKFYIPSASELKWLSIRKLF